VAWNSHTGPVVLFHALSGSLKGSRERLKTTTTLLRCISSGVAVECILQRSPYAMVPSMMRDTICPIGSKCPKPLRDVIKGETAAAWSQCSTLGQRVEVFSAAGLLGYLRDRRRTGGGPHSVIRENAPPID